jgi:hypothetical protein
MSYFMHYTNQRPDGLIAAALAQAKSLASNEFKNMAYDGEFPKNGYGITTIRPYHIQAGGAGWGSSNYWLCSMAAANTWTAWIDITQTELAYEIVSGFFDLEAIPRLTELYITGDGLSMPTINVEESYAVQDISTHYFAKPFIISPQKSWQYYQKFWVAGIEREGLTGYTLAKRAFLLLRN